MGPFGPPETLAQLGPVWERAKRPLIALLLALVAIVVALAWLDLSR